MKKYILTAIWIILCFILQTTVFKTLSFASVSPNLLIILTASYGFMHGKKEGLWVGFVCGLLIDVFFGSVLGFYALIYMSIGYLNGFLHVMFYPDDIKLPMSMIALSDLAANFLIYFFLFLFRGQFDFVYYLLHIIIPELIYTILVSIFLYLIVLKTDQKIDLNEKREH